MSGGMRDASPRLFYINWHTYLTAAEPQPEEGTIHLDRGAPSLIAMWSHMAGLWCNSNLTRLHPRIAVGCLNVTNLTPLSIVSGRAADYAV